MISAVRDVRFWMAVGLLALLIGTWLGSGLLRVGDPPEAMGVAARVLLLLAVGALLGAVFFLARIASGRANKQVLDDIAGSGEPRAPGSKVTEEEQQLQAKFSEAAAKVSKMRFGKVGSRKHLYQLPWYVVIGSPGSGKTTAIRQSGLDFPLDEITQGGSLGGVGGTRNCDWWITEQAVLLDTAGRYTTQDSDAGQDSKGWKNFLRLLNKHRRRQPLNGAILVVSTEELLHMSDEQWKNHARVITRRLNELAEELQMTFPVYLVVTKVDLLSGCREFFDYLEADEQEQIWGATLAEEEQLGAFNALFKELAQRLHSQLPSKIRFERDVRRRRAIYSFPWQFEAVGTRIEELLQGVFSHRSIEDIATLRGVYFSSAVQEGTPIERLVGGISSSFGVTASALPSAAGQSRSLFLHRLFPEVIFREAFLAGTNASHERTIQRVRMAAFAAILLVGVGLAIAWTGAFGVHRTLLADVRQELALFDSSVHGADRTLSENLEALQYLERATLVFSQQEHPWLSNFGMYESSIDRASRNAYLRFVADLIAPTVGDSILSVLDTYQNAEFQTRFDSLKAYLMLTNSERRDDEWLVDWITLNSLGELQGTAAELTAGHLAALFEAEPEFSLRISDVERVSQHQQRLARVPLARQLYSSLVADFGFSTIDFTQDLGSYFFDVFELQERSALSLPYAFTLEGYDAISFAPQSSWVIKWLNDRWVLGDAPVPSPLEIARELEGTKRLYSEDYIQSWNTSLASIGLTPMADTEELGSVLVHLSDGARSPLARVLDVVVEQTTLPVDESLAVASEIATDLAKESLQRRSRVYARSGDDLAKLAPKVERFSVPDAVNLAFAEYRFMAEGGANSRKLRVSQEMADLRQWLRSASSQKAGDSREVQRLLLTSEELRPPFSDWVAGVANSAREMTRENQLTKVFQRWRQAVYPPCSEAFDGNFPFVLTAARESSLADFDEFFRPRGIEPRFVDQYLRPLAAQSNLLGKNTRWTMRQGERIRDAFYNGSELGFSYSLTGVDVDDRIGQLIIESGDEQAVRYRHGPPVPLELSWPDGNRGIRITFMLKDGTREYRDVPGAWAIFRLVSEGSLGQQGGNDGLLVSIGKAGYRAVFRLNADARLNPFTTGLLSKYQCRQKP
ncbi:MAG: type VI secretion system membrane subunit TssM [Pseudomonadota bacterium]